MQKRYLGFLWRDWKYKYYSSYGDSRKVAPVSTDREYICRKALEEIEHRIQMKVHQKLSSDWRDAGPC